MYTCIRTRWFRTPYKNYKSSWIIWETGFNNLRTQKQRRAKTDSYWFLYEQTGKVDLPNIVGKCIHHWNSVTGVAGFDWQLYLDEHGESSSLDGLKFRVAQRKRISTGFPMNDTFDFYTDIIFCEFSSQSVRDSASECGNIKETESLVVDFVT